MLSSFVSEGPYWPVVPFFVFTGSIQRSLPFPVTLFSPRSCIFLRRPPFSARFPTPSYFHGSHFSAQVSLRPALTISPRSVGPILSRSGFISAPPSLGSWYWYSGFGGEGVNGTDSLVDVSCTCANSSQDYVPGDVSCGVENCKMAKKELSPNTNQSINQHL